jgi:hypothetical protein
MFKGLFPTKLGGALSSDRDSPPRPEARAQFIFAQKQETQIKRWSASLEIGTAAKFKQVEKKIEVEAYQ